MKSVSVGLSDVGRKRTVNEDAFLLDDALGFYVVADGVGGHAKGEIASAETIEQLHMWVAGATTTLDQLEQRRASGDDAAQFQIRRLLESGVQSACYMVFGMAQIDPDKKGMSSTCSALLVRGNMAYAAHVGDSRVYRLREGQVLQLTEDHTLINYKVKRGLITPEQAATAKGKNVITRAVGHKDYVQVDTADIDVIEGDRFLICSDGLHNYLRNDNEVVELIEGDSLEASAAAAIAVANERGGKDNITAIVVQIC